jgi:2-amino-4-hydroxy-6-hydroxymethyldihydropteridine diphosphokinase
MSHRVFIGIGANEGNRSANCMRAIGEISCISRTEIQSISPLFETSPVGDVPAELFLNCVVEIHTDQDAEALWSQLNAIEMSMGRLRTGVPEQDINRPIDLDILFFNDDVIRTETLTIPHPRVHCRRFVLQPLVEIAPNLTHPVLRGTMRNLLRKLDTSEHVKRYLAPSPASAGSASTA